MLSPIQLPQRVAKKDALDKILQGLQIAEGVFKIPVAYEQMRAYGAEAAVKNADAATKEDARAGIVTASEATKGGRSLSLLQPPGATSALKPPAPGQPPLIPSPKYYGPTRQQVKTRQGGEVVDAYLDPSQEEKSKFFSDEGTLHKDWRTDRTTIATKDMYRSGKALLDLFSKKNVLGPDDLAGVFKFIQTVEPGSFVREGEAAAAQEAAGLKSQLKNLYERLASGTKFDAAARNNMKRTVSGLMATQLGLQGKIDDRYRARATEQGFKPENVVIPEYEEPKAAAPKPGATPKPDADDPLSPDQRKRLNELEAKKKAGTLK